MNDIGFLVVGIVLLAGSAALIWEERRRRRKRLAAFHAQVQRDEDRCDA